jgi:hypothetical protein
MANKALHARVGVSAPSKSPRNPMETSANPAVINPHLANRDALELAIVIVRQHPERARELAALERERGWLKAAKVAVFDCQSRALRLPVWENPPCVASVRGKGRAARLLRRMLKRGISRWHPRPLEAIAVAGPAASRVGSYGGA